MTTYPVTKDDFSDFAKQFQTTDGFKKTILFGIGRTVHTGNGTLASVRYPVVNGPDHGLGTLAVLLKVFSPPLEGVQNVYPTSEQLDEVLKYFEPYMDDIDGSHPNISALMASMDFLDEIQEIHFNEPELGNIPDRPVITFIFDDVDPIGVEDITLKLYGISLCDFKPNTLNLKGAIPKLPNVTWVEDTPFDLEDTDELLFDAAFCFDQPFAPTIVDKLPLYIHRINAVKMGVRITDAVKVRLGAYLGHGCTLMPGASYINFNAGAEGPNMIEGRISSSAWVGAGTDIGGGASILGVLSGGNSQPIVLGRNCLLEVNSSLGIPVGDCVIIAANTAVMAASRVFVNVLGHEFSGKSVKASQLAGISEVTFRVNNTNGQLEVCTTARNIKFAELLSQGKSPLNADLHLS